MVAIFVIGGVRIEGTIFGDLSGDRTTSARIATKAVLGGRQQIEKIGQGDKSFSLSGKIAPFELGGYSEADALEKMADEVEPAFVMRGDGVPMGWYVITSFRTSDRHYSKRGVGRIISVQMDLTLDDEEPNKQKGVNQLRAFADRMGWS